MSDHRNNIIRARMVAADCVADSTQERVSLLLRIKLQSQLLIKQVINNLAYSLSVRDAISELASILSATLVGLLESHQWWRAGLFGNFLLSQYKFFHHSATLVSYSVHVQTEAAAKSNPGPHRRDVCARFETWWSDPCQAPSPVKTDDQRNSRQINRLSLLRNMPSPHMANGLAC